VVLLFLLSLCAAAIFRLDSIFLYFFFFFKQKTAYEIVM